MDLSPESLPEDVDELRAAAVCLMAERDHLLETNARLQHIIEKMQRLLFGKRSEKLDPDQLQLGLEDLEQAAAEVSAEQEKVDPGIKAERKKKSGDTRPSLPKHLPHIDVVIEPSDKACPCCRGLMHVIGEETSKRLDVIPAQFQVVVTHRPKYACRSCEGQIVQAPAPAHLIEGGLPTERMVAHVLVNKYADHLPLYRQAQALARQGILLDRSTLAFWVGYAGAEFKPLWRLMRDELLSSSKLFVDETTAPVLDPGRGRTKTGYFWTIARDNRPWGGTDPPAVVYTYAPGRGAEHAIALLKSFTGVLQTDGYQVYKKVAAARAPGSIVIANCWSHSRRNFFDLAKGGSAPIAVEALQRIAKLYQIEKEIRGQSAEARRLARLQRSKAITDELKLWLESKLREVSGRSPIAEAIRYVLGHWIGLTLFLDDGRIELDTNVVERTMRPIALNRKNALFAGSDEGAESWAVNATLIETCKLHGVNPQTYMADVLTKLVNLWPNSRLAELTPWAWKAANPVT
jgi:transposase